MEFIKSGSGKDSIVFLHGWGKKKEDYGELVSGLARQFTVYILDLPGFGETPLKREYDLTDYVTDITEFLKKNKIKKPVLMGHSFGGRVAIKLVANGSWPVEKLILIDSAGIERKGPVVKMLNKFKSFKEIVPGWMLDRMRSMLGSKDYLKATGNLRETLKNVVAEDLEGLLPKIKVPTLLIWGRQDQTTPVWQGELMNRLIQGSTLSVITGGDHGVPYRKPEQVAEIIRDWSLVTSH